MKQIKKRILVMTGLVLTSVISFAQSSFDWSEVNNQAQQFSSTAVSVGKYIAGGILALSLGFMLYQLLGNNPKKKESVIAFIIALVLNTILWAFI